MRNNNIGTMVWKVVLKQFYFEQTNANDNISFIYQGMLWYWKVRAINNLIDNRPNKSNEYIKNECNRWIYKL